MNQGACRSDSARKRRRFIRDGHAANRIYCVADKALSLITNKSDERWGGFRRTAAGGRTRIPSKQASRAKLWIHGNLWGCWAEMAVRSLSLSLSFVIEWSRASNADARNLHPLRFCCWTTATVFFVSRNAGAARRHALLLLRPGLQLHAWPAV